MHAKQLFAGRLTLRLPVVSVAIGNEPEVLREEQDIIFDKVDIQQKLDTFVPDAIAWKCGRQLMVEFCVTSASSNAKIAYFQQRGIHAVEIDLAGLRNRVSFVAAECGDGELLARKELEAINDLILFTAPRKWLSHPQIESRMASLKERIAGLRGLLALKVDEFLFDDEKAGSPSRSGSRLSALPESCSKVRSNAWSAGISKSTNS
jgi:hypothetical protein